jgi:hypothetical protein
VIYVLTVHWVDPKWIAPQRRGLDTHLGRPFRVFANLEGLDRSYDDRFDHVTRFDGNHPEKLNDLARAVARGADADDLLVFLDGDAFPVRPWDGWLDELLSTHPLAAVRRDENAGDLQPHPCFCVCRVGFWEEIGGDWRDGTWTTAAGQPATDVGGRLLENLRTRSIEWRPVLRSNAHNPHPVLYGLYEGRVYHHGAGFRPPIARADQGNVPVAENEEYLRLKTRARARSVADLRLRHVPQLTRLVTGGMRARKLDAYIRAEERRSAEIYRAICDDPDFYRRFEAAG